jgi:hypothetical protein
VHNAIVAQQPYALAAIVATGDPLRLYSGLSAVVSSAADTKRCAILLTFRAAQIWSAPELEDPGDRLLTPAGRDTFARSLLELRDSALSLEAVDVFVCAATSELTLVETDLPVISTPRFLRETAGAQLFFV